MKKGVSLTTVVIAITVMIILIASVSVIGSSAINTANFEEYKSEIERVSNEVNLYITQNKELPVTNDVISANSLGEDFLNNLKNKNDLTNKLYVVDVTKLSDDNIEKGKGNLTDKDIFVVTENTNNVYYLKGYRYKGKVYFTY